MRKFIAIAIALTIVVAMAVPASAVTPCKWDFEAGKSSADRAVQQMIEVEKKEENKCPWLDWIDYWYKWFK